MNLPSPRTLEAFIAAARLGSLAAASTRVAMSVPALSRRLTALEADLGVHLFERRRRGLALTDAGKRYLAHAVAVLDRLEAAAREVAADKMVVRVTTIPALATRWLLPRLPSFAARHPDVEVDVRTSTAFERLDGSDFDLAIRLAPDKDMSMEPLLPVHLMPVWSPGRACKVERLSDVLEHPLLGPDHRPEFWQEWLIGVGADPAAARIRGIDPLLLYERTINGPEIAIGIEPLVADLLERKRLSALDTYRLRSSRSFFALESSRRTPALRRFKDWLWSEARD